MPPKAAPPADPVGALLADINKQHGHHAAVVFGENPPEPVEVIPSGSVAIDAALGVGGYPCGRVIEIYGPESAGKTSMALHAMAEAQKLGHRAAFIDAEHALDPVYAARLGVDMDHVILSQPDNGEQALEIADKLIKSGLVGIVVIDSVAALTPKAEIEGEMGDSHVGLQARLMSQALRKITAQLDKQRCTVIFINQLREKIGVMWGSPETTSGGKALKFYASIRMDVRRVETLKDSGVAYGNRVRVKIVKNKVASPFAQAEVDLIFGQGISRESELLDLGVLTGAITKSGAWYSFGGELIGQGKEAARATLLGDPAKREALEAAVRAADLGAVLKLGTRHVAPRVYDLPDRSKGIDGPDLSIVAGQ